MYSKEICIQYHAYWIMSIYIFFMMDKVPQCNCTCTLPIVSWRNIRLLVCSWLPHKQFHIQSVIYNNINRVWHKRQREYSATISVKIRVNSWARPYLNIFRSLQFESEAVEVCIESDLVHGIVLVCGWVIWASSCCLTTPFSSNLNELWYGVLAWGFKLLWHILLKRDRQRH